MKLTHKLASWQICTFHRQTNLFSSCLPINFEGGMILRLFFCFIFCLSVTDITLIHILIASDYFCSNCYNVQV